MERLERRLLLRPRSDRPLAERIYRFAEAILSLKELEYLGHPQSGTLPERLALMEQSILSRLEKRYGLERGRHGAGADQGGPPSHHQAPGTG